MATYMVLISKKYVILKKLNIFNQNIFNSNYSHYYSYIELVFIFNR